MGKESPSRRVKERGRAFLLALLATIHPIPTVADSRPDDGLLALANMTLEELGELEIDITAKEEEKAKDAFNIVTVVTREDIRQAHCRDIAEALQLVPGFNLVQDVTYLSLSVRGLYGFEGRVLFMINQIPVSDLQFGGFPLNNHIPIATIDRIEVIRGPGSVLYGGIAELSVVNIVTEDGAGLKGARVAGSVGSYRSGVGQLAGTAGVGNSFKDGQYSVVVSQARGRRSDGMSRDFGGTPSFRHNEDSAGEETEFIAVQGNYKGLSGKFVYDGLHVNRVYPVGMTTFDDASEAIEARRYRDTFKAIGGALSYERNLSDHLQMFTSMEYQQSIPFEVDYRGDDIDPSSGLIGDQVKVERYRAKGHLSYKSNGTHLVFGGEATSDHASLIVDPSSRERSVYRRFPDDAPSDKIDFHSHALFATAKQRFDLQGSDITFSVGARADESELFAGQVSPRTGVIYKASNLTAKLLYHQGFRAPLVGNSANSLFGLDPAKPWRRRVTPETSTVYEAELGYQLSDGITLTSNIFYQKMSDIIEFVFDPDRRDVYSANGGSIGTYGFESELRVRGGRYRSVSSVSYFAPDITPSGTRRGGETYIDPHIPNSLLAVPTWKLSSHHSYRLSDRLSAQFFLLSLSGKRVTVGAGSSRSIDPEFILTTGLLLDRFFQVPGLSLDVSLHDLLDQGPSLGTPFRDSGADSMQYRGRELVTRLEFKF